MTSTLQVCTATTSSLRVDFATSFFQVVAALLLKLKMYYDYCQGKALHCWVVKRKRNGLLPLLYQ